MKGPLFFLKNFSLPASGESKRKLAEHDQHTNDLVHLVDHLAVENYSHALELIPQIENGRLSQSLAVLISNLMSKQDEEQKKNWFVNGMAAFSDLLNQTGLDLAEFCDKLISKLVKYVQCNQGAIFLAHYETSSDEEYLILQSCYAYEKKKFMEKKIEKGVGLIGQCWIEGNPIVLNEVPADFVKITSGLGESVPNNVMMAPMKYNGKIEGVIELASFGRFEDSEVEFLCKVSEGIAAQIQFRRSSEEIKKLLHTSEHKTQLLTSQEEELRQNSEEILAQREDLERKVELQKRSIEKLQSSEDSIIINVAGRQRMLSQQMAFFSTMLYHGKMSVKSSLQETVDLFDHSLFVLENGGIFKGVDYDRVVPPSKEKMQKILLQVKEIWAPIHDCINTLLRTDFSQPFISVSKEKTFCQIRYVEDNIDSLLKANQRLTQAYVEESFSWRKKVFDDMESLFTNAIFEIDHNGNGKQKIRNFHDNPV